MVFASIPFLVHFLPVVMAVYFAIALAGRAAGRQWRATALNAWILASSIVFYTQGEGWLIVVMFVTAVTDFTAGLLIAAGRPAGEPLEPHGPRTRLQRAALITALTVNLALLAFFKYANFGLATARNVAGALGAAEGWSVALDITLPLGISFYTFQSMSYTIDVYRGEVAATRSFLDFGCLVTMFPHLVAGPIIRYRDIGGQLRDRVLSRPLFVSGLVRFLIGLGKKTLIANTVAGPVDRIFALPASEVPMAVAWLGAAGYAVQIYFDFSGYSDMAIGLGRMLGFEFLENFRYPYAAQSLTGFWRRWHISLSTWFRDYLYVPLGGNRISERRTYLNLLIVFFLCGLWHGAQWVFVCWGLYHGAFLIAERAGLSQALARWPRMLRHAYTIVVVLGGWVLFRAPGIRPAVRIWMAMAGLGVLGGWEDVLPYLTPAVAGALAAGALFSVPVLPWLRDRAVRLAAEQPHWAPAIALSARFVQVAVLVVIFVTSFMWLAGGTYNPFIYYRF